MDAVSGEPVATEKFADTKRMGGGGGDFYGFAVDETLEKLAEKLAAIQKLAN